MLTIAAFVFALAILVAVHEWGHYRMARACGVKVLRFSVGLGPRVWGWTSRRSGTEFVVGLLPLGGYVKMLDEREAPVAPAERHLAFNTQPLRSRALIVAAGPVANLILAVVLYSCVNWTGIEQPRAILAKPLQGSLVATAGFVGGEQVYRAGLEGDDLEDVVSFEDFRWWLTRAALGHHNLQVEFSDAQANRGKVVTLPLSGVDAHHADARLFRQIGVLGPFSPARLGALSVDGAAQRDGLKPEDVVLQVDGTAIVDAEQLREVIRTSGAAGTAAQQRWLVERGASRLVLAVTPKVEKTGDGFVGRIGAFVGAPPLSVTVRYGPLDGLSRALHRTGEVSMLTLRMMGQIVMGDASLKNLSGPITIADYAGKSAAMGLTQFLVFLALISISLGVLNLLPVPVLDGGHLMYYLWESLTGQPVSQLWMDRLQRAGLVILLMMMSIAVFNDVARVLG